MGKSEIVNTMKTKYNLPEGMIIRILRKELPKSVGNCLIGSKRYAKYVIDNLDVAVQLVNSYYDSLMTDAEKYQLYSDIVKFIHEGNHRIKVIMNEFMIQEDTLDKINQTLLLYNQSLDFYKIGKVRVSEDSYVRILGILRSLINEGNSGKNFKYKLSDLYLKSEKEENKEVEEVIVVKKEVKPLKPTTEVKLVKELPKMEVLSSSFIENDDFKLINKFESNGDSIYHYEYKGSYKDLLMVMKMHRIFV